MSYTDYLAKNKDLIAMIHLPAMPGTPRNTQTPRQITEKALREAQLYQSMGIRTVMIENMHDIPYIRHAGPEIVGLMAIIGEKIKSLGLYCGIQILAGCNKDALAVAHSADLDFIRVEGYVFAHIGDEGVFESCAGDLLRYRRFIGADHILVFTDIKKKHSSHAITADVNILDTAEAARFFLSDGVIITGNSTGMAVDFQELRMLQNYSFRKIIGSGITIENLNSYMHLADLYIVGSALKIDGKWFNDPDPDRISSLINTFKYLMKSR